MIESHIQANVSATHSARCARPEITVFCFDIVQSQVKLTEQHLQSNLSAQDTESTILVKWCSNLVPCKFSFPSLALISRHFIFAFPFPHPHAILSQNTCS